MTFAHINKKLNSTLHFKQWSNKGYAAFSSLGKEVHISALAIALIQWIGKVVELTEQIIQHCLDTEKDEAAEELLEQETLQVLTVMVSATDECRKKLLGIDKNLNCR